MAKLQEWWNKYVWETRAKSSSSNMSISGDFWNNVYGQDNYAKEKISERKVHSLATAYTCINVRSQTVSALPINIIQEAGNKKNFLTDHPAYYPLAQQPNSYLSSANFFLTSMINSDSWGNAYAYINRDFKGRPSSFDLWCPYEVDVTLQDGQAWYKYKGEMIPGRDVLHFRWFSYDGLCGVSPIRLHANTFGMAMKQDRYSSMTLGAKPPGILSYDGQLTPEQSEQNKINWKKATSGDNLGETAVLGGNWKYVPIIIPPEDAQYIAAKKLTKQEIYGIYRVPPNFAQDWERATWSNAENGDLHFVKHTVVPIIRVIEQECNMKLFTEKEKQNTYVKFNLNGLLRGDLATRQAFYQSMVNTGIMNRNEARSYEDLNPYQSGDDFLVQGAMVPADMLRSKMEKEVIPSAKPPMNGEKINGFHHVN